MSGYGENGTLTGPEWERVMAKVRSDAEARKAGFVSEAERRRQRSAELDLKREASLSTSEDERLEKLIEIERRAEAVARRNAKRCLAEEVLPAHHALEEAKRTVADDRVAECSIKAAAAWQRLLATPTPSSARRLKDARAELDSAMLSRAEILGDRVAAIPTVFADEQGSPDPLVLELLTGGPRAPVAQSQVAAATAAGQREETRRMQIRWIVSDSTGGLAKARQLAHDDPALAAEAERAWFAEHGEARKNAFAEPVRSDRESRRRRTRV